VSNQPDAESDPHFKVFHELMPHRVREILLVSSPYDAYIMEEDSSLASRIINEYRGLNLSSPPRITRADTGSAALELLEKRPFDLVLAMPNLGKMGIDHLSRAAKRLQPDLFFILLAHSMRELEMGEERIESAAVDNSFIWCCDSEILLAIIKNLEDGMNVDHDTRRAMVRVILVVEDSPLFRSQLLPILYRELVRQTQAVLKEGLNEQHRLLKMRARPKILTASSHEEAMELYTAYQPYVYAVLSDLRFSRGGKSDPRAGLSLLTAIRRTATDMPLLLFSSDSVDRKQTDYLRAVFLRKDAADLQERIHDFFLSCLGFGEFIFRLPDTTPVDRAAGFAEFEAALKRIPDDSLMYHAGFNHFSHWFMARAEVELASRFRRERFGRYTTAAALRRDLVAAVHAQRRKRQLGVVSRFSAPYYDSEINDFVSIGRGSMGGKARGLAFMAAFLNSAAARPAPPFGSRVAIPKTCVILSEGFEEFVRLNSLQSTDGLSDREIAARFVAGSMPPALLKELEEFLRRFSYPLAIRSSSLLEDARFMPYAGLYSTLMLANNHPDFSRRFKQFVRGIKLVYASTRFAGPRAFSRSIGQGREDGMAVLVQQLVGRQYGSFFYPGISGTVQSHNYYPLAPMRPEHGIAAVALGFGKTVVEGERSLRFSPFFPRHLPQFSTVDDILATCQRRFYALDMSVDNDGDIGALVARNPDDARDEFPVRLLSSTYLPEEKRIRDSDLPGRKVLTFAALLKYNLYPLAEILQALMDIGRRGLGCEVEIEFAVDLEESIETSLFNLLQIRPLVTETTGRVVKIDQEEKERAVLVADNVLGHGLYNTIADIVYVEAPGFDNRTAAAAAREIGGINRRLQGESRSYLLIGPGRWGSGDPWLGIPVSWQDISGVGVIVETGGAGFRAEPSQGTHFFQNISSLGIPYITVDADGRLDEKWLRSLPRRERLEFVSHIRLEEPLLVKVDGRLPLAVVLAPEE